MVPIWPRSVFDLSQDIVEPKICDSIAQHEASGPVCNGRAHFSSAASGSPSPPRGEPAVCPVSLASARRLFCTRALQRPPCPWQIPSRGPLGGRPMRRGATRRARGATRDGSCAYSPCMRSRHLASATQCWRGAVLRGASMRRCGRRAAPLQTPAIGGGPWRSFKPSTRRSTARVAQARTKRKGVELPTPSPPEAQGTRAICTAHVRTPQGPPHHSSEKQRTQPYKEEEKKKPKGRTRRPKYTATGRHDRH